MKLITALAIPLLLIGCGRETRTSWENSPQFRHTRGMEIPPATPGTTRVVYPDNKPIQTFGAPGYPEQIKTRFEAGIHINEYDKDGYLISHRWQRHGVMGK